MSQKYRNTKISYLYRDAYNYKQHNECVVEGVLTDEQKAIIMGCLNEGEYFIPGQLGMPEKRFEKVSDADHCWFELEANGFQPTNEEATLTINAEELVTAFQKAKENWDEMAWFDELTEEEMAAWAGGDLEEDLEGDSVPAGDTEKESGYGKGSIMKANDKIKVHFYNHDYSDYREIKTKNYDKVFEVYEKNGKLGIDWNTDKSPYDCKGEVFTPFDTFAQRVIFENVDTGERFRFDNIKNGVIKVSDSPEILAGEIDRFSEEYDPYEYADQVEEKEEHVSQLYSDIKAGNVKDVKKWLTDITKECEIPEHVEKAKELLGQLEAFGAAPEKPSLDAKIQGAQDRTTSGIGLDGKARDTDRTL